MGCSRSAAVFALLLAVVGHEGAARAQTVVVQPVAPLPPPAAPAGTAPQPPALALPASVTFVPGVTQAQAPLPSASIAPAPPPPPERPVELTTRPNRSRLMTGLVAFGMHYVASVGIAATSPHPGDANLWLPALGPWLDLGARGPCGPGLVDCSSENGNKLVLVADGLLQTFGILEIVGAFLFPEVVPATLGRASGPFVSFTPSNMGPDGYGLSAVGEF